MDTDKPMGIRSASIYELSSALASHPFFYTRMFIWLAPIPISFSTHPFPLLPPFPIPALIRNGQCIRDPFNCAIDVGPSHISTRIIY